MAKGAYVGIAGVARKVKSQYVGVAGVARKVKKAYTGVNGVARLCWEDNPNATVLTINDASGQFDFSFDGMTVWTPVDVEVGKSYSIEIFGGSYAFIDNCSGCSFSYSTNNMGYSAGTLVITGKNPSFSVYSMS